MLYSTAMSVILIGILTVYSMSIAFSRGEVVRSMGAISPLMLDVKRYVGSESYCTALDEAGAGPGGSLVIDSSKIIAADFLERDYAAGVFEWHLEVGSDGTGVLVVKNTKESVLTTVVGMYSHAKIQGSEARIAVLQEPQLNIPDLHVNVLVETGSTNFRCS